MIAITGLLVSGVMIVRILFPFFKLTAKEQLQMFVQLLIPYAPLTTLIICFDPFYSSRTTVNDLYLQEYF